MPEPAAKTVTVADLTQKQQVLWHLSQKGPIDPLTALGEYGIQRLAARVYDLREDGYKIERIDTSPHAEYRLAEDIEYTPVA